MSMLRGFEKKRSYVVSRRYFAVRKELIILGRERAWLSWEEMGRVEVE